MTTQVDLEDYQQYLYDYSVATSTTTVAYIRLAVWQLVGYEGDWYLLVEYPQSMREKEFYVSVEISGAFGVFDFDAGVEECSSSLKTVWLLKHS